MFRRIVFGYIVIISLINFVLYGIDKKKAQSEEWRVKESTLLFLGVIGGSIGGLLGMRLFHHKTRKIKFWLVNILCLILEGLAVGYYMYIGII